MGCSMRTAALTTGGSSIECQATIVTGGGLWAIKGQPQDPLPRRMTVALDHEWASLRPFGADDQKTAFTPARVAIEKLDGRVVSERFDPRDSFHRARVRHAVDPLQRAYFNGYAMWTYLTTPFLFALEGISVHEIVPVEDNGETWVGLQAQFPPEIATHSSVQEFYFGDDHLLRRHDYRVDVAGGFPAVQYVYDIVESRWDQAAVEAQGLPRRHPRQRLARSADGGNRLQRRLLRVRPGTMSSRLNVTGCSSCA